MFSLIITIISIALVVGVTGATMYYLSGTGDSEAILAAAELLTQSEQIAAAIDMRAFQEKGELAGLDALVTGKYLMQVPLPPEYAFVSGESSVSDWQVPQANHRPVVLVSNKIKASVCAAFNNKMLSDASIPAKANPALRIQCFGAAEPYSVVINPSMNPDQLVAGLPTDTGTATPEPDAQLPVPQTVALSSANLCFKQGVAGNFDFKTVFSASQEATPTTAEVVWSASGTLPAGMTFDANTGLLSGKPTETYSGDYTVTASYKNAEGQQVYKLLVKGSELEAVQVESGAAHTCAVTALGGVKCWGFNTHGQLGNNSTKDSLVPVDVVGLPSGVTSVSAGDEYTCAVTRQGGVKCWGYNGSGNLGNNSTSQSLIPVDVHHLTEGVTAISAGSYHACALTTSGEAKCWGTNFYGQLGDTSTTSSSIPVTVANLPAGVKAISAGTTHTCAITKVGGLKCWGEGREGRLGPGPTLPGTDSRVPVNVYGLTSGVIAVSTGGDHTCAITSAKGVKCWGLNTNSQLGDNSAVWSRKVPEDVYGLTYGVASISSGREHTCAVTTAGAVKCWGRNLEGQLGNNSTTNSNVPVNVIGLPSGVVAIRSGGRSTCAETASGRVNCWGRNGSGQLGNNSTTNRSVPVAVLDPYNTTTCTDITLAPSTDGSTPSISGTISLTPATLPEFKVGQPAIYNFAALYKDSLNPTPNMADVTWSGVGTLPAGLTLDSATGVLSGTPTEKGVVSYTVKATYKGSNSGQQTYQVVVQAAPVSLKFKQIDSGASAVCGVTTTGGVYCWGAPEENLFITKDKLVPKAVTGLASGVASITVGDSHACALMTNGGLKCWGKNDVGQLGSGDNTAQTTPVDVADLTSGVKSVSAGYRHTCAVLTSGALKCWGGSWHGAAGSELSGPGYFIASNVPLVVGGLTINSNVPRTVPGLESGVKDVDTSGERTCVVMQSGSVKCWGQGWWGAIEPQSPYPYITGTNIPQNIVGVSDAVAITTFDYFGACALTQSGGVKCWGQAAYVGTDDGTFWADEVARNVVALPSGVKSIARNCALLTTGGVQCWGYGFGTSTAQWYYPRDLTNATQGIAGIGGRCAVTTGGGVKCWGITNHDTLGYLAYTQQAEDFPTVP